MEEIIAMISAFIVSMAVKYPVIITIAAIVGVLRMVLKPLMVFLHEYVLITPSVKDDEILAKVESSRYWKWFLFALDYIASIKVKK